MNNDFSVIIASAIGAFVSIFIFIGSTVATSVNTKKPLLIEAQKAQLHNLFEPLMKTLEKVDNEVTPELLESIHDLIYSNFAITPTKLYKEYKFLISTADNNPKTIFRLKDIASANYNWLRKQLSYPCDKELINIACLDFSNAMGIVVKSLINAISAASFVFIFNFGLVAIKVYTNKEIQIWLMVLGVPFFLLVFLFIINSNISLRKIGLHYKRIYKKSKTKPNNEKIAGKLSQVEVKTIKDNNYNNENNTDGSHKHKQEEVKI